MKRRGILRVGCAAAVAAMALAGMSVSTAEASGMDKEASKLVTPDAQAGTAQASTGQVGVKPSKVEPTLDQHKAANEVQLAWYHQRGISVDIVTKQGFSWVSPTAAQLRAAAEAKGVAGSKKPCPAK